MKELIERLEKATGPDRELDGWIAVNVGALVKRSVADVTEWFTVVNGRQCHACYESQDGDAPSEVPARVPHYTTSIDAALTLVPEDHDWKAGYSKHVRHYAEARDLMHPHKGVFVGETDASRAVALCIAALKARQSVSQYQTIGKTT